MKKQQQLIVSYAGIFLSILGYVPAYLTGQCLYALVRTSTKLPVAMNSERALLVFFLILFMCMASASLAMRRLVDADPAEIF